MDDRIESDTSIHQRILSQFQGDWVHRLNVDQMFILIDGILPFEACLYYQVLPLFVEGSRLNLGMVCPDDTVAMDYVRRIVSYLNCSLVPRAISAEALRVVLTAHLNHVGNQAQDKRQVFSYGHHRHGARTRPQPPDQNERQTLVVDSPEDLEALKHPSSDEQPLPPDMPPSAPVPEPAPVVTPQKQPDRSFQLSPPIHTLPVLEIQANYVSSPVDVLATLPPSELLRELLARVLLGGIGRLFFERHAQYGRVLWSQNGVLQSVLDRLAPSVFVGVIQELKQMAHLPPQPVMQPQQVELEYLYERNRVLLRVRVMPAAHGEEATLQVLRGAALKFYQRQQVTRLEHDALGIAQQLQHKLNEIRDRAYQDAGNAQFEMLPALSEMLHRIEDQLDDLGVKPPDLSSGSDDASGGTVH